MIPAVKETETGEILILGLPRLQSKFKVSLSETLFQDYKNLKVGSEARQNTYLACEASNFTTKHNEKQLISAGKMDPQLRALPIQKMSLIPSNHSVVTPTRDLLPLLASMGLHKDMHIHPYTQHFFKSTK